jgi:uncharacterized protein YdiU (UPF0061 family)
LVQAQSDDDGLFGLLDDVVESLFPGTNARRKNAERAQAKARAAADAQAKAHAKWIKTGFTPAMNVFAKGCAPPRPVQ